MASRGIEFGLRIQSHTRGPCQCDASDRVLEFSRKQARRCACRHPLGLCTVDDVYERVGRSGHTRRAFARIAGAIFRNGEWRSTCLRTRSRRLRGHGREVKVWHLRPLSGGTNPQLSRCEYAVLVRDHRARLESSAHPADLVEESNGGLREPLVACELCGEVIPQSLGRLHEGVLYCPDCRRDGQNSEE